MVRIFSALHIPNNMERHECWQPFSRQFFWQKNINLFFWCARVSNWATMVQVSLCDFHPHQTLLHLENEVMVQYIYLCTIFDVLYYPLSTSYQYI